MCAPWRQDDRAACTRVPGNVGGADGESLAEARANDPLECWFPEGGSVSKGNADLTGPITLRNSRRAILKSRAVALLASAVLPPASAARPSVPATLKVALFSKHRLFL